LTHRRAGEIRLRHRPDPEPLFTCTCSSSVRGSPTACIPQFATCRQPDCPRHRDAIEIYCPRRSGCYPAPDGQIATSRDCRLVYEDRAFAEVSCPSDTSFAPRAAFPLSVTAWAKLVALPTGRVCICAKDNRPPPPEPARRAG
jgi:hypothetical protein